MTLLGGTQASRTLPDMSPITALDRARRAAADTADAWVVGLWSQFSPKPAPS